MSHWRIAGRGRRQPWEIDIRRMGMRDLAGIDASERHKHWRRRREAFRVWLKGWWR